MNSDCKVFDAVFLGKIFCRFEIVKTAGFHQEGKP